MSRTLHADACVVGAGAGGAVLAAELAEGGMDVVVLEQGAEHNPDGFTARPPQMLAGLYRDGGQTVTIGNPPIALPLGRGLGVRRLSTRGRASGRRRACSITGGVSSGSNWTRSRCGLC